jgi:hypothetical protein
MGLGTEEVRVPHAKKTADNGDVLLQRSLLEVLVHGMGACEELVEVIKANVEGHAQANGAPHAVAAANPVGEAEHVLLVNAELGDLLLVSRQSDEVLGNVLLVKVLEAIRKRDVSGSESFKASAM